MESAAAPGRKAPLRIAFLISGSGSTLANILERSSAGKLNARVVGVAASRDCPGLEHARRHQVPYAVVERGSPFDADDYARRMTDVLAAWQPELIVMGGFLTLYRYPAQYRGRVINIHPALLPDFGGPGMYGDRVHEAVLESGADQSGASVHFVDERYDEGPLIAQVSVPVLPGDDAHSLGERVREAERELLPEVISWFGAGKVTLCDDGTVQVDE